MANLFTILTLFLLCFLVNSIEASRLLAMAPMNGDHNVYTHSSISLPPSPALNGNNYSDHNHTISMSPSPSPNTNNRPNYHDHNNNNVSSYCAPSPTPSSETISNSSNTKTFDVRAFGATGDGITDDTTAFKSAWDGACQSDFNAQVFVPKGFSFVLQPLIFTGPCMNGVTFQIEGTIVAPDGPENWPSYSSKRQWIIFYRAHGLTFQGGGLVDGRGDKWWNLPCKPHKGVNGTTLPGPCDSPVAIRFFGSKNLTVRGVRLINSPEFHIRFDSCQSVTVDSLYIRSPGDSPNTDGIHVENTSDVTIYNSLISNGDDCISIGAGSHNLDIKNVTCGPSHGISIGSLGVHNSRACVSNISVTNCLIRHSDNGVRIKTWQGGSGSVSAVTFDQIRMDMVRNPIIIDQYYCLTKKCSNQTSAVSVTTISYSNIKGTYDPRSPPVHLACSDSIPCTNITLSGVELQPGLAMELGSGHKHGPWLEPFCWNAYGNSLETYLTPLGHCLLEGMPYLDIPGTDIVQC